MAIKLLIKSIKYQIYDTWKSLIATVWNKGIKLFWFGLWIRKNEFHKSLSLDVKAMMYMNKKQQSRYLQDITKRRQITHMRSLC